MPWTHNIGNQMKRKDITKTFVIITNLKRPFGLSVHIKIFQRCDAPHQERVLQPFSLSVCVRSFDSR